MGITNLFCHRQSNKYQCAESFALKGAAVGGLQPKESEEEGEKTAFLPKNGERVRCREKLGKKKTCVASALQRYPIRAIYPLESVSIRKHGWQQLSRTEALRQGDRVGSVLF
jgi:hypothetical protein